MPLPQLNLEVSKPTSNAMLQSEVNEVTSSITNDELANTLPAACPLGLSYVLTQLWGKLIMWAHTTLATGHPDTLRMYSMFNAKHW